MSLVLLLLAREADEAQCRFVNKPYLAAGQAL